MAIRWFRMGGGINRKASTDAKPDESLSVAYGCSFDEVGAVHSAKGRNRLNNDTAVGAGIGGSGTVLGGFDGTVSGSRYRYVKRGSNIYRNGTALTAETNATNVLDTAFGTLVPDYRGGTTPTFGSSSFASGFNYFGKTYFADGSARGRMTGTTMETWGLKAPGYMEFSAATTPISGTTGDATITVTTPVNHGLRDGLLNLLSYPFDLPIELVGFSEAANVSRGSINRLHDGRDTTSAGDISVVSSSGLTLDNAGTYFTITYQNAAGAMNWAPLDVDPPTSGSNVNNPLSASTVTAGDPASSTNEVQRIEYSGSVATSGYFSLVVSNGSGGGQQRTVDLPYNCTAAQMQAAFEGLDYFADSTGGQSSIASVTSANTFTFEVTDTVATGVGGGNAGFMRVGPKLSIYNSSGGQFVAGTYRYAYTFWNGVAESNFSAVAAIEVPAGAVVLVDRMLVGPVGTTHRRIYRSDVNGKQLYLIGIDDLGGTGIGTFYDSGGLPLGADHMAAEGDPVTDQERQSSSGDTLGGANRAGRRGVLATQSAAQAGKDKKRERLATNLGLIADWTDHDIPPAALKHVGLAGTTVFGIDGSDLVFSKIDNPEHWPLGNRITPGRNTSETLRAWLQFDREVIAYTDTGLYRLTPLGLSFEDSRFEEVESPVGCAGEWAATALDGLRGHIFLATTGLYLFDGARVTEVSYQIEPMFTDSSDPDYIHPDFMSQAIMVTSRDRVFMAYRSASTAGNNNRLLMADFQDMNDPKFMVWPIEVTSMWRERGSNNVLIGNSSGNLFQLDVGYSDDGGSIAWEVETKEFPLGGGTAVRLDEVLLDADFAGATTTVEVTVRVRGQSRTATYTSTASGRQRLKFKLPMSMFGEVAKVNVSSSAATKRGLYAVGFTLAGASEP